MMQIIMRHSPSQVVIQQSKNEGRRSTVHRLAFDLIISLIALSNTFSTVVMPSKRGRLVTLDRQTFVHRSVHQRGSSTPGTKIPTCNPISAKIRPIIEDRGLWIGFNPGQNKLELRRSVGRQSEASRVRQVICLRMPTDPHTQAAHGVT